MDGEGCRRREQLKEKEERRKAKIKRNGTMFPHV